MKYALKHKEAGVTLIELLIVMFMLGLFATAVHSLYRTHQNAAYTSDEVMEVQQNLRIAMESISRDVKMAGFLIPRSMICTGSIPVQTAVNNTGTANADSLTMSTATSFAVASMITVTRNGAVGAFVLDDPASADPFSVGDIVTIVRPSQKTSSDLNSILPGGGAYDTGTTLQNTFAITDLNPFTLAVNSGSNNGASYVPGDVIVRLNADRVYPSTIRYCLGPDSSATPACGSGVTTCPAGQLCLMRIVNSNASDVIAQNLTNLQFRYLMDDGTEVDVPTDLCQVRAVRVIITGQTVATANLSGGLAKVRQIDSIIQIRNR